MGNTKVLYQIVKELSKSNTNQPPIKNKDGKYATTCDQQMRRWKKHFSSVLNCSEPEAPHDFEGDSADIPALDVSSDPITDEEVARAIKKLKNGKAAGPDHIQPELLKHAESIIPRLTNLFNTVWHKQEVPSEWKDGIIIPLPKKGDLSDCNNWRGITLLSVPGKVFASIVLNRLRDGVEAHLRTEKAGFRSGRSCNKQIFTLRQIIEEVTAWQKPVMINFIDFRKAFDSVHRPSLWSILGQYGIPGTFVNIIQNLYKGSRSCVKLNLSLIHI